MKIEAFNKNHVMEAMEIVRLNYIKEQENNPELPAETFVPDLTWFTENGLGVAAVDKSRLIGFLCAYPPMEDVFGTTNVKGTFSPIQAHGVLQPDKDTDFVYKRSRIYSLLYQAAAERWVGDGILSHGIAIFAHDKEAINSFFYNGFGLRFIDAIRSLKQIPDSIDITGKIDKALEYREAAKDEWKLLLPQHNDLIAHLGKSPAFMKYNLMDEEELYRRTSEKVRYFVAMADGQFIAYIKLDDRGENYITENGSMVNICGAYCSPLYRGKGIYHNLLCYLMKILQKEGYQHLGVDFESFNPTARGFWLKYFHEYTNSVVRRIDDKAITNN